MRPNTDIAVGDQILLKVHGLGRADTSPTRPATSGPFYVTCRIAAREKARTTCQKSEAAEPA